MRKLIAIVILLVAIGGLVLAVGPWVSGFYFQRDYNQLFATINTNNANKNIPVYFEVNQYQRGWFSSKATIIANITDPQWTAFLESLGLQANKVPHKIIIDQRIQHGPIIYHPVAGFSSPVGFAMVSSRLRTTPEVMAFLQFFQLQPDVLQEDNDLYSLMGRYYNYVKIAPFHLTYAQGLHVQSDGLESHIQGRMDLSQVSGTILLKKLSVFDNEDAITIPETTLQFDQYKSPQNLWLGSNALLLPKLTWKEVGGRSCVIQGVNFSGDVRENAGMLSGSRLFLVENVDFDHEQSGPYRLQVSVKQLDAQVFADMLAAYQAITQRGELYQSQLRQKMLTMLPGLVSQKGSIKLDEFSAKTPQGDFLLQSELTFRDNALPDDIGGFIRAANLHMNLRIAKPLAEKLIQLASGLSLLNQDTRASEIYADAREKMYLAGKQNAFFLSELVRTGFISLPNALQLYNLQKKWVSLDEYAQEIKQLLFTRKISLATDYQLFWQYAEVNSPLQTVEEAVKANQAAVAREMHSQLADWLKNDYITQQNNDYLLSAVFSDGELKINNKSLSNVP